jgi:BRCA1-associated protein
LFSFPILVLFFKEKISLFYQKQFATFNRDKQALEKRLQNSTNKLTQVQTELTEEKDLRKALQLNQTSWQTKYNKLKDELSELKISKEEEIADLKEQIRDLMFFLDAQKQIKESADRDEIAAGRIVIPPNTKNEKSSGSRGHKHHKKH